MIFSQCHQVPVKQATTVQAELGKPSPSLSQQQAYDDRRESITYPPFATTNNHHGASDGRSSLLLLACKSHCRWLILI